MEAVVVENLWNILWKLWNYSLLPNIVASYNILSWNRDCQIYLSMKLWLRSLNSCNQMTSRCTPWFIFPHKISCSLSKIVVSEVVKVLKNASLFPARGEKEGRLLPTCRRTRASAHRARLRGGPQVAWMVQEKPDRSGKREQEQNSTNLGTVF